MNKHLGMLCRRVFRAFVVVSITFIVSVSVQQGSLESLFAGAFYFSIPVSLSYIFTNKWF